MDEQIISTQEFPEGLMKFSKEWDKKNPDKSSAMNHNLYLLQTVDRDGNITGEAYGMNLMTDAGFKRIYTSNGNASYSNKYLYIGSGDTEPTTADTALTTPITTSGSTHYTINDNDRYYTEIIYGARYDPATKIVSTMKREYRGYFNYNISGISSDVDIKEIGYGQAYNKLDTHALIYDAEGNPSFITKRINERLIISMFWSICFKPDWITAAYNKGVFIMFSPHMFLRREQDTNYSDNRKDMAYFYQPLYERSSSDGYNSDYYIFNNDSNTTIDGDTITSSITMGSRYMEGQREYMCNTIITPNFNRSRPNIYISGNQLNFILLMHDKLQTPEEIVCDHVYTNSYASSYLTKLFGMESSDTAAYTNGMIPATNFDIQSLSMYNHLTHSWDIEEEFINNPNYEYLGTTWFCVKMFMYLTFLDKSQWVYVYINTRTDIPINAFGKTGMTMYATDEYWNTDSYELITNTNSIDESLQTKRYYIRTDAVSGSASEVETNPTRSTVDRHRIVTPSGRTLATNESRDHKYTDYGASEPKTISSDKYGYIVTAVHIVYPDIAETPVVYNVLAPSGRYAYESARFQPKNEDRLVTIGASYYNTVYPDSVRVYDMSGDGTTAPTYNDYTIEWSEGSVGVPYYTESNEGFVVMQRINNVNEAIIMNIYGDDGITPTFFKLEDVRNCIALNTTTNCVYMTNDSNTLTFEIFDMLTQTIIDSFSLPELGYSFAGITGWKNWIYVRVVLSDTYSTYMYDMNTKQLTYLPSMNYDGMAVSNGGICKTLSCAECMVLVNSSGHIKLFSESDPTNPISISTILYHQGSTMINAQLKHFNDGKQLLLAFISDYNRVCVVDIGWVLDNGPVKFFPYYQYPSLDITKWSGGFTGFYKGYVYFCQLKSSGDKTSINMQPYQLWIPHKMVGTTYTIQSYNNPKQIGGRKYTFSITNNTSKWSIDTE